MSRETTTMNSCNHDGSLDKRALDAYITGGHGQDDDPADEMEAWQQTASELSAERDDLAALLTTTTRERDALAKAVESYFISTIPQDDGLGWTERRDIAVQAMRDALAFVKAGRDE